MRPYAEALRQTYSMRPTATHHTARITHIASRQAKAPQTTWRPVTPLRPHTLAAYGLMHLQLMASYT
jgi:hypothetical protein